MKGNPPAPGNKSLQKPAHVTSTTATVYFITVVALVRSAPSFESSCRMSQCLAMPPQLSLNKPMRPPGLQKLLSLLNYDLLPDANIDNVDFRLCPDP